MAPAVVIPEAHAVQSGLRLNKSPPADHALAGQGAQSEPPVPGAQNESMAVFHGAVHSWRFEGCVRIGMRVMRLGHAHVGGCETAHI